MCCIDNSPAIPYNTAQEALAASAPIPRTSEGTV